MLITLQAMIKKGEPTRGNLFILYLVNVKYILIKGYFNIKSQIKELYI